jgi:hypothetical protein
MNTGSSGRLGKHVKARLFRQGRAFSENPRFSNRDVEKVECFFVIELREFPRMDAVFR